MAVKARADTWIWLDANRYPACQDTVYSGFMSDDRSPLTVAEFTRTYHFPQPVDTLHLRVSGDSTFCLYVNGACEATGPVTVGGDFIENEQPEGVHYASRLTLRPHSPTLTFFVRVKLLPLGIDEYSQGHGGFMLAGRAVLADGTEQLLTTDASWQGRRCSAFKAPYVYDNSLPSEPYAPAQVIPDRWHAETAPLPMRQEALLIPNEGEWITVEPGEEKQVILTYPRIYGGFIHLRVKTEGPLTAGVSVFEDEPWEGRTERFTFVRDDTYRGYRMYSIGGYMVTLHNTGTRPAAVAVGLLACCYPVDTEAKTVTDDRELNRVLEVCRHTLQYCRQFIHLDSPGHCEPLACTGDYYIETLMTAFSFGDMALAEMDVRRTARMLCAHRGVMFHTTYSLLWVQMLYDVYRLTGHTALLEDCEEALLTLLQRFETYIGDTGLVETPPSFMFVDWLFIDGLSLHHPPKALGQTCLNILYFGALRTAGKIYTQLGREPMAAKCRQKAAAVQSAVNRWLYDPERGLYFEGLNTPTPAHLVGKWMPQNTDKRYFLPHSNILAAYTGLCSRDECQRLVHRVMTEDFITGCQPYFLHFLLEAVYRCGLRDTYTLAILEQWKPPVAACPKGLAEGFIKPEPAYSFDHCHAWGGTPLYSLPLALTGLELVEPGFRAIRLSPSLLGLGKAKVEIPTPYGLGTVLLQHGQPALIDFPPEVRILPSV